MSNHLRLKVNQLLLNVFFSGVIVLAPVCLISGCGGSANAVPAGTVAGTIKFNDNALKQARVNYVSSTTGTGIYADIMEDGTYELPSEIPAGEYRVYLTSPGLGDAPPSESGNPELKDALKDVPKKYQSEQATDLQVVVKEGENTFDFDLKP